MKKKLLFPLLLLSLGLLAFGVGRADVPSPAVPLGTTGSPIVVKVVPSEVPDAAVAESKADRAEKRCLDRKLVDFNGDLAHYTEILAILAGLQFLALGAQALFLRAAFREAKRSGDIARDAMIAGERAFVFALGLRGLWELDQPTSTYRWRFRPILKNFGDTPTKNMTMHTRCEVRTVQLPAGFDFDYGTPALVGSGLLAPNTEGFSGLAPPVSDPAITPQDILDAQSGRKLIFIWGWVRYRDVFPGTPLHITRFCWVITPVGDPTTFDPKVPNTIEFQTIHHMEGNCADDECGS
jgi:hypothetical protein